MTAAYLSPLLIWWPDEPVALGLSEIGTSTIQKVEATESIHVVTSLMSTKTHHLGLLQRDPLAEIDMTALEASGLVMRSSEVKRHAVASMAWHGLRVVDAVAPLSLISSRSRHRSLPIEGKRVDIIDGAVPMTCVGAMSRWFSRQSYNLLDVDSDKATFSLHWKRNISLQAANRPTHQAIPLFHCIDQLVRITVPEFDLTVTEIKAYATLYGDLPTTHRDDADGATITAILYCNNCWEPDWAGELIICNNDQDAVLAVSPKPGRIVIFRGDLPHRAGAPSRLCFSSRNALVFRYCAGRRRGRKYLE
jgi:SM-20-related protein